jgi:hypothetical protein
MLFSLILGFALLVIMGHKNNLGWWRTSPDDIFNPSCLFAHEDFTFCATLSSQYMVCIFPSPRFSGWHAFDPDYTPYLSAIVKPSLIEAKRTCTIVSWCCSPTHICFLHCFCTKRLLSGSFFDAISVQRAQMQQMLHNIVIYTLFISFAVLVDASMIIQDEDGRSTC